LCHVVFTVALFLKNIYGLCRGDVVEVETWCQGEGKVGIRRDWLLTDVSSNKLIGRATRFMAFKNPFLLT
jgi:fatty acyl-ACP thioesterase A